MNGRMGGIVSSGSLVLSTSPTRYGSICCCYYYCFPLLFFLFICIVGSRYTAIRVLLVCFSYLYISPSILLYLYADGGGFYYYLIYLYTLLLRFVFYCYRFYCCFVFLFFLFFISPIIVGLKVKARLFVANTLVKGMGRGWPVIVTVPPLALVAEPVFTLIPFSDSLRCELLVFAGPFFLFCFLFSSQRESKKFFNRSAACVR